MDSIGTICCTAKLDTRHPRAMMPRATSISRRVLRIEEMHTKFEYKVYTLRMIKKSGM
jgi:hypothetical protein